MSESNESTAIPSKTEIWSPLSARKAASYPPNTDNRWRLPNWIKLGQSYVCDWKFQLTDKTEATSKSNSWLLRWMEKKRCYYHLLIEVVDVTVQSLRDRTHGSRRTMCYTTYTIEWTTDRSILRWQYLEYCWRWWHRIGRACLRHQPKIHRSIEMKLYKTEVCLPYCTTWTTNKFVIKDKYKDGLCYAVDKAWVPIADDSIPKTMNSSLLGVQISQSNESQEIQVGENPNPPVDPKECKDQKGKFEWKKKKKKKKNCNWIAKKNKCNAKGVDGNRLWQSCPNVCNRCADM